MQKKFKLLKWYPGLPLEWKDKDIILHEIKNRSVYVTNLSETGWVNSKDVENNPDYWESISFKYTSTDNIDVYDDTPIWFIDTDELPIRFTQAFGNNTTGKRPGVCYFANKQNAQYYIEASQICLTTDDGVNLKKGDRYYFVHKNEDCPPINSSYLLGPYGEKSKKLAYFSTKEAAQKYIDSKKIIVVTEDGVSLKEGDMVFYIHSETPFTVGQFKLHSQLVLLKLNVKYFSTKGIAEQYLINTTKLFSLKDLQEYSQCGTINYHINKGNIYLDAKKLLSL